MVDEIHHAFVVGLLVGALAALFGITWRALREEVKE